MMYVVSEQDRVRLVLDLYSSDAVGKDVIPLEVALTLVKDEEATVLPVVNLSVEVKGRYITYACVHIVVSYDTEWSSLLCTYAQISLYI